MLEILKESNIFAKQNVDRVVLAREMNIREIEEICHNCSIDIEVFVHGALCMSYSGQCLNVINDCQKKWK